MDLTKKIESEDEVKIEANNAAENEGYALPKQNLYMIAVGFVVIIIGFACMIGGGSEGTAFNPDIFSSMRITVAPIIALIGFFFEMFAILWLPKKKKSTND